MIEKFRQAVLRKKDLRFEDIIRFAEVFVPEEYSGHPWTYFRQRDEQGKEKDDRGTRPLTEDEAAMCYLAAYARLHTGKIHLAVDEYRRSQPFPKRINIVDWGCGQGLATFVFLDYLENLGIHVDIENVLLVEPSRLALDYAELYLNKRFEGKVVSVRSVCAYFSGLEDGDLTMPGDAPVFHLFSSILDVEGIVMKDLTARFRLFGQRDNVVFVASPKYYSGDIRIQTFVNYLNKATEIAHIEQSDKQANPKGNFTYNIWIGRLLPVPAERVLQLKFFPARQFFAEYRLDTFAGADMQPFWKSAAFDVSAPYEIGTSYMDDVDPVYAVLSNIISRGLPTKASPFVEEALASAYGNSRRTERYGGFSYEPTISKDRILAGCNSLVKGDAGETDAPLVYTPIGVARIQKTIVEALVSGHLSIDDARWKVMVEEDDVPCGALAIEDLRQMFTELVTLTEDFSSRRFPEIELSVVNGRWTDSPLHLGATVYASRDQVPDAEFDLVIDYSSTKRPEGEYPFTKYKVRTDCYYAVYPSNGFRSRRHVYTTDLITYRTLTRTDETGQHAENLTLVGHLEYFLQLLFRKEQFRPGQLPILNRALRNKSVIGLLPTGGGKSLTYQLAALLQPGITLVVDPLQSLMKDQYDGLLANGIDCCTYINSSIKDSKERADREYQVERAECQIVFMSPERLCIFNFRKRLQNMHDSNVYFAYGVIDEVHCVSEWGQDFRFTYLHLGRNLYRFVRAKNGPVTLFGLTATASFDVLADVERELSGSGSYELDSDALIRCEDTNRLELQYRIVSVPVEFPDEGDKVVPAILKQEGLPWSKNIGYEGRDGAVNKSTALMGVLRGLPRAARELDTRESVDRIVHGFFTRQGAEEIPDAGVGLEAGFKDDYYTEQNDYDEACIVFCPHRHKTNVSVDTCAEAIREDGSVKAVGTFYSADDDAQATENMANLEGFRDNHMPIMVATKAFGMGIDKPNVRYTVNVNYSNSLEAFVQEAGRAGRDRKMALATILVSDYKYMRVNDDCPVNLYRFNSIRGHWFKEDDFKAVLGRIRERYGLSVPSDYIGVCSPDSDLIKLDCEKDSKLFNSWTTCASCPSFATCPKKPALKPGESYQYKRVRKCCECKEWQKCRLRRVDAEFRTTGFDGIWGTYDRLMDVSRAFAFKPVARNFVYQSPDYQHMWFFYTGNYPGRNIESQTMGELLKRISLQSFVTDADDTYEFRKEAMIEGKGFMQTVLDQPVGTKLVSILSYRLEDQNQAVRDLLCPERKKGESDERWIEHCQEIIDAAYSKAIYRMCCIGFIDDFTRDYGAKTFRVLCERKPDGSYYPELRAFFRRYFSEEKAEREMRNAMQRGRENEIIDCLAYLTEFIYENLAVKKKRALDEMRAFCNEGIENNRRQNWKLTNEDLKDHLFYYFNSKYAREDYLADNGEPYSLTVDTDYGKESPLNIVHKYVRVVEEEIGGTNQVDNLKHLQGAVRIIMRSLTQDNPVIDLLNVFCILALGEHKRNGSIHANLERSYANAYWAAREKFDDINQFYDFFRQYKEDIFAHGADKSVKEELELIELNAEISWHRDAVAKIGWTD